jgi:hypothetical protein
VDASVSEHWRIAHLKMTDSMNFIGIAFRAPEQEGPVTGLSDFALDDRASDLTRPSGWRECKTHHSHSVELIPNLTSVVKTGTGTNPIFSFNSSLVSLHTRSPEVIFNFSKISAARWPWSESNLCSEL